MDIDRFIEYIELLEFALGRHYDSVVNIYADINYVSLTADIYLNGRKIIKSFEIYNTPNDFIDFLKQIKERLENDC